MLNSNQSLVPPYPIPVNQKSTDITSPPNKQELSERKKSLQSNESLLKTTLSITQSEKDDYVENWSEDRVRLWFIENQLNLNIFEKMKPFDGSCLKEMFQVKKNLSQFYYESLKDIKDIKLNNIILFSSCLDKLFR